MPSLFSLNIRAKIILPYLLLTLVLAMVGIYVVTTLVASSLDERLTNQLLEAGRVVSDSLARREIKHLESARMVAFTRGLAEALQAQDRESVTALAQPAGMGLGIECLIIVDRQGHDFLHLLKQKDDTFRVVQGRVDTGGLWMVQTLLQSGNPNALPKRGLGINPIDGRSYYFTAIPVGLGNQVVGVVIVGTSLDTLLPYFKTTAVADVVVYQEGGRAVGTTFALPDQPEDVAAQLEQLSIAPQLYDQVLNNLDSTLGENVRIRNRWYRIARAPLRVGKDGLGVFAVGLPSNFIVQAGATSRNTYALLFTIALGGVIVIGYLIAQRITHPLGLLVRTSQAVTEGDLEQRTGIERQDEIGVLAASFDEMTDRLSQRTHQLEMLLLDYKETASRMRAILSSIGDGVVLADVKGGFVPLNMAAQVLLDEIAANWERSPLMDLAVGDDVIADPSAWRLKHRRFEVGDKVVNAHSAAVRTDEGRYLGSVVVLRDVTAEVEADRLKDAFVAHVSHELRTPLTAIKGYSWLLLAGSNGSLDAQQRSFLATITHNTENLIAMINGLLDFSEMEAKGHLGLQQEPVSVSKLVREVAEEWRPQLTEKGLLLEVEAPEAQPVNADARRLRWVVVNLVRNAWQYTGEGGRVSLQVSRSDGHVTLKVADTGIGMSPEQQREIFRRFHRAYRQAEDEVRGLGLGLYVARAIVEAHGGTIELTSQVGAGSTFRVILPALEAESADEQADTAVQAGR